jgi:hypothetical protein
MLIEEIIEKSNYKEKENFPNCLQTILIDQNISRKDNRVAPLTKFNN